MTPIHHLILALFSAALGCCVGSFLNVCAYRIPRGMSLIRPRSRCPRCGSSIRGRDNVPILSWLCLRGRCRDCGCAIPASYLVVELGIGLSFAAIYLVELALVPGDPWERMGLLLGLIQLLVLWSAISICATAGLIIAPDPVEWAARLRRLVPELAARRAD
jgi:leader peptidase (prepilin peptidase) / N-methyltransferase